MRAPKYFPTRGDEVRKIAPGRPRPATAFADWEAAPRPYRISYVPLVDCTLIFFIEFTKKRLKNVTQNRAASCIACALFRFMVTLYVISLQSSKCTAPEGGNR